ncbi:hypothetical protein, partial [Paenibacillus sp. FSL R7-0273]|uniref:hypothetical protein n=1 Tax=Paenibacillus sp. FSL R7-0273 TaxID=1536772 RepID=UPI00058749FF
MGCIYRTPEEFVAFAADYFELPLSLDAVVKIYDDSAITEDLIRLINPHCDVKDVLHELKDLKARA